MQDQEKKIENWKTELSEYGQLHNEDCCVHFEGSQACDTGTGEVECCENMKLIAGFFEEMTKTLIETLSYDMGCKDEAQRKEVSKMLFNHHILGK